MCGIRKNLFNAKCSIILFLILSQGVCFAAEQATITVVFSSDIEPYRQSYEGFKAFFDEKKMALRAFEHDLDKEDAGVIYSSIKKEKPDLIFTIGTKALQSAKEKITDTPIVFSMVLNPGAMSGPNVAGVSLDIPPEIKLKHIRRILPRKKNIGLIYSPQSELLYEDILNACTELKYHLVSKKISSKTEFPGVLEDISPQVDCFMMTPDTDIYYPKLVEYLLRASLKDKIPVIGLSSNYVKAGALIAFDCDYGDIGNQAGELALEILSGGKQVNSCCVSPRKVKFSLNLMTAERLGVKIPPDIIKQASEVFGK
ncbi:MAG: ABC transporter substrate-binding protein [Sedimentisphaerales bacterium]|nr:ABC transporter substrate-binding protein [Sedimentisphaerales bacterium]